MTVIGAIAIRAVSSVAEARSKILGLALALGFDEITAVRLATATSQVCRTLAAGDGSGRLEVSVRIAGDRAGLELAFLGRGGVAADGWLGEFFEEIAPLRRAGAAGAEQEGTLSGLSTLKWLPRGAGVPGPELLEAQ